MNVPAGHLVLVGLMGSGKTTVGRQLAQRLGRPLLDSDAEIESRTGRTVREIFATDGERAFRALETEVLRDALASQEPSVIAAAGGVVLAEHNRQLLQDPAVRVVWLRADVSLLADRVLSGAHRPLLDDDPRGTLEHMAASREDLYRQVADAIVTVDGRSPGEVAEAVLR